MAKYTYNCEGMSKHEPMMMEVEATDEDMDKQDEMAMDLMMTKVRAHLTEMHDEMANTPADEMREMIMGAWKKDDDMAEGNDMADSDNKM